MTNNRSILPIQTKTWRAQPILVKRGARDRPDGYFNGRDLSNATLDGLTFIDADFTGTNFTGANLSECRFVRCRFQNTILDDVCFVRTRFEQCVFDQIDWSTIDRRDARFIACIPPRPYRIVVD